MYGIPNLKYKTTLCQKWQASKQCFKGYNCYFAHGHHELRTLEQNHDQISYQNQVLEAYVQQNNFETNYKTIRCKFYSKGKCELGNNCTFYHHASERRPKPSQLNLSPDDQIRSSCPAQSYDPSPYCQQPFIYSPQLSQFEQQPQSLAINEDGMVLLPSTESRSIEFEADPQFKSKVVSKESLISQKKQANEMKMTKSLETNGSSDIL